MHILLDHVGTSAGRGNAACTLADLFASSEDGIGGGIALASTYHAVLAVNGLRADFRGINGASPRDVGPLHLFHDPRAIN
jgi:hypothetical protein